MGRRRDSGDALIAGLVLVAGILIVGIFTHILFPLLRLFAKNNRLAHETSRFDLIDQYLGRKDYSFQSEQNIVLYTAINFLILSPLLAIYLSFGQKLELIQIAKNSTLLGIEGFVVAIIGGFVLSSFFSLRNVKWLAWPVGYFTQKQFERTMGEKNKADCKERRDKIFGPHMAEIEKFVVSHSENGGQFPRPVEQPLISRGDNLEVFFSLLQSKGFQPPIKILTFLINSMAREKSITGFEKEFFTKTPIQKVKDIHVWISAYLDLFESDERYIADFVFLVAKYFDHENIDLFTSNLVKMIKINYDKRILERKQRRLQDQMDKGHALTTATISRIDVMDGHDFEKLLENLFRDMGYRVTPTKQRSDQGGDIVIEKNGLRTVVQAKRYSENIGNKAVQEVTGAKAFYKCDNCLIVTNQFYTPQAVSLAEANSTELWDREKLIELISQFPQHLESLRTEVA